MSAADSPASNRIITLDIIRGIAVMGIFSVNVIAFAMIEGAYFHPPAYGFENTADRLTWFGNFVLIDGKMRSLFSILFGASMLLVAERAEASGQAAGTVHYRRMLVLLLFGLAHFYLLWFGDILTSYALVGMIAFMFWRLDALRLVAMAASIYVLAIWLSFVHAAELSNALAIAQTGPPGAPGLSAARDVLDFFSPTSASFAHDFQIHQSFEAFVGEMTGPRLLDPLLALSGVWPETLALMLIGMAGYRSGFLTGSWRRERYRRIALIGIGAGVLFSAALAVFVWSTGFTLPWTTIALETWSMPAHPVMALGYASLIILLMREESALSQRLAAVGRCAFSNYLGTSLLATFVFNGWGLGLYGSMSRSQAWLLAPALWLLMLAWSKPWLDRFQYGPFEWAWRSLARGQLQPIRKRTSLATA